MNDSLKELASSLLLQNQADNGGKTEGLEGPKYQIPLDDFFTLAVSVDCVVFGFDGEDIKVLLIERGASPFRHHWALPGDLVYPTEDLQQAARRVLLELTGLEDLFMQQIKSFGRIDRHPLGRVITVAYIALIRIEHYDAHPDSWADKIEWHSLKNVTDLAFDHDDILEKAVEKLKTRVRREPLGFELLPDKFTLNDLQSLYEAVLGRTFDKGNFRKKILGMNLLVDLNELQQNVAHRPAKLYRFDSDRYEELRESGFSFEL